MEKENKPDSKAVVLKANSEVERLATAATEHSEVIHQPEIKTSLGRLGFELRKGSILKRDYFERLSHALDEDLRTFKESLKDRATTKIALNKTLCEHMIQKGRQLRDTLVNVLTQDMDNEFHRALVDAQEEFESRLEVLKAPEDTKVLAIKQSREDLYQQVINNHADHMKAIQGRLEKYNSDIKGSNVTEWLKVTDLAKEKRSGSLF